MFSEISFTLWTVMTRLRTTVQMIWLACYALVTAQMHQDVLLELCSLGHLDLAVQLKPRMLLMPSDLSSLALKKFLEPKQKIIRLLKLSYKRQLRVERLSLMKLSFAFSK